MVLHCYITNIQYAPKRINMKYWV